MRVLGVGDSCDLGDLYVRLQAQGHQVRVRLNDPDSKDVFTGLLEHSHASWADDLAWVGKRDGGGVLLFEGVGQGERQSQLRRDGYLVVGGSAWADRLEIDRAHGQAMLRKLGLPIAHHHEFHNFDAAIELVRKTRKRYVLKFSGSGFSSTRSYVGCLPDGSDMVARLTQQRNHWTLSEAPHIVLMEHLQGVEVGVGAWFNGHEFVRPANIDWEHKRFFAGDLGELTGEMGTVVSYRHADKLFQATLAGIEPYLREMHHVGYINLNMIVNEAGTWPLEFTCRFGYPGFAVLSALHAEPWDATLLRLLHRHTPVLPTHPGFAVGVVLTVPPFPYPDGYERLSKGMPICFASDLNDEDRTFLHYGEVAQAHGQLVTAGQIGYIMVVTGRGETIQDAQNAAYALVRKVAIPNVRYRTDIGTRLINSDYQNLQALGWLP
ncbi:MAG: phosphoribosylglycinamide synthetase C domain-containing protein [Deltaproteobacteria bacterium]|nr:phosphoribosylglycinamide synthetase C domain-containing protein [Deltaproteobacteria bacterium]